MRAPRRAILRELRGGIALRRLWSIALMLTLPAGTALAQGTPGKIDLGAGVQWKGATGIGDADATETASNGSRFRLFSTSTTLTSGTGLEGYVRFRVAPAIDVGLTSSFSRSKLRTAISSDVEGIPDTESIEEIGELVISGTVLIRLNWRPTARSTPFLTAGAGYLRHLHENRTLIESGSTFHLGAGLDYVLRTGAGTLKATGVRADFRAVLRSDGVAFDDEWRAAPAFTASIFARF